MTNPLIRLRRAFNGVTIIFFTLAGGALLWPAMPAIDGVPPAGLDAVDTARFARADPGPDWSAVIIDANIFSRTRAAPANRYDPLAVDVEPEASMDEFVTPEPEAVVPHLFGTVLGPGGAVALLRLDARIAEARPYREGDAAGGYRVLKINEQSVVLGSPQGQIVLRLTRSRGSTP